jgi:hypothetical protein
MTQNRAAKSFRTKLFSLHRGYPASTGSFDDLGAVHQAAQALVEGIAAMHDATGAKSGRDFPNERSSLHASPMTRRPFG